MSRNQAGRLPSGPSLRAEGKISLGVITAVLVFGAGMFSAARLSSQQAAQTPQTPEAPAGDQAAPPPAPKMLKEDKNSFVVNFKDVELEQIIKTFADITGKNFILEQIPKGKITIVSPVKIPKSQALNVFQAILNLNGYNMVATSIPNLYRIVTIPDASKSNIPIYLPEQKAPAPAMTYVIRFIPLKYMDAQEAATLVQPLLSKESSSVMAYTQTNTLIIVDTALNIDRINRVLKALDVPSLEPEMEIVYLHNSSAQDISGTLSQIFSEAKVSAGTGAPSAPGQPGRRAPTPAKPAETSGATQVGSIKIIPETRLNALILIAQREMLDRVKRVIAILDVQSGDKGVIHVYYCKNARAAELASTLASLAGGAGAYRPTTTTPAASSGLGGAYGGAYGGMGGDMGGFGLSSASRRQTRATGATSAVLSGGLFEGEIKISADEAINSLIVVASSRDYDTLKAVLEKLDIPRKQVFVEAVLLEVTLDQNRSYSSSLHGGSPLEKEGVLLGSSAPGGLNSLTLLSQLAAGGVQLPTGMTVAAFTQMLEVPGTDGKMVIPSAGLILSALASDSNVNVLSAPTILTTDNQDAEIQVGQRIPMPTGQTISTGGLASVSITRETVGIKLKITPQICESGTIRMDIATETSSAVPSALGVNVNTLGVTTSLKTAMTTVIVKDAQTIVIGGLMQDTRSNLTSRWPFIGDIPILGWLFKSMNKTKSKNNLIILITPHIVRTDEEVERMRQEFKNQYDSFIEESLNREGKSWNQYFESKYKGSFTPQAPRTEETIDLTGPKPKLIPPEAPAAQPGQAPEPEVQPGQTPAPDQPQTLESEPRQEVNPLESATALEPGGANDQIPNGDPPPAAAKKRWWQRAQVQDQDQKPVSEGQGQK